MDTGILRTSLMGLNAAQANISTTSQNIANVNIPGYHRQATLQTTTGSQSTTAGFIGNGVDASTVSRAYNSFLETQVTLNQGQLSNYQTYTQYATQLNALLGSQNSGFAAAMSSFFSSVQTVANDPTSNVARQGMLYAGQNLAGQVSNVNNGLTEIGQNVNQGIESLATQINAYAQNIASLNQQIGIVQSAGGSGNPNALMDQRDAAVAELNKLVNVTVTTQDGNGYNLYIGNGLPLVTGTQATGMTISTNPADPTQSMPALKIGTNTVPLDSSQISGGQLGGLLAFRDQVLVPTQRELGKIAYSMSTQVNAQSVQGYDLNGNVGTNFFNTPPVQAPIANSKNTGNVTLGLTITDINKLANSDYKLSFDGTNYSLTRASDGTTYTNATLAGLSAAVNAGEGFSFSQTGGTTMQAGDTYLIRPTQYSANNFGVAISDPNKIAAAGQGVTATATGTNTGTATVSSASLSSTTSRPVANVPITLSYSGTYPGGTITATDSTAAVLGSFAYSSGTPISFNGISVTITGAPNTGDTFKLTNSGTSAGPGDNSNALLLAGIQNQKLLNNSANTLQSTFSQLVGKNATLESNAKTNQQVYQSLTDQATQAQQSYSGVNLDEEAANLIKYQQAYQAAAKAMQVASQMFNTILTAIQ